MKRLLPGLLLLLSTLSPSFGQSPVQAEASLIVSSAYLWRGEKVCGFHLQPGAAIKIGRFTIENSDYISLDGKYQEVDLGVSYSFGELSVHLADYYSHTEGGAYDSAQDSIPSRGGVAHKPQTASFARGGGNRVGYGPPFPAPAAS